MTPAEREAVRQELREEYAAIEHYIAEHGDPWQGLQPDWSKVDEADTDDHAA